MVFFLIVTLPIYAPQSEAQTEAKLDRLILSNSEPSCLFPPFSREQVQQWRDEDLVFGKITIEVDTIFPEDETGSNNWLYRSVNNLHITTRPHVLRRQLLVKQGENFSTAKIEESERILRANNFLHDVEIRIASRCGNQVQLTVWARDLWTLFPDISIARSADDSSTRLGFRDSNFLGLGKKVVVVRESDEERKGYTFNYLDRNTFGSRNILAIDYSDNDDGDARAFKLEQPFYSLDTRWSFGISHKLEDRTDKLYSRNQVLQEFRHDETQNKAFIGFSPGQKNSHVHRWLLGYTELKDKFLPTDSTNMDVAIPADRLYRYPWIAWQFLQNNFLEVRNFNLMGRTEDINAGIQASILLGYSSTRYSANNEGLVYEAELSRLMRFDGDQFLGLSVVSSGIETSEGGQNILSTGEARYHHNINRSTQFFTSLAISHAHNLFDDQQLLLGGDNGLRGYPSRYQEGDRRFLLTLEQRFYLDGEYWRLFNLGAVAFADIGRAWFPGQDNGINGSTLRGLGFGLRFSPTRAGKDIMLHLDFAFPLDTEDDQVDDFQINFEAKKHF